MPGQYGNFCALKNGSRAKPDRAGMMLARLGRRYGGAYCAVNRLRKALETHITGRNGRITLVETSKIQTITRLEASCRVLESSIRKNEDMDPAELHKCRHSIVQWSCQRDRLLAELLGEAATVDGDPWASLDNGQTPQESPGNGPDSPPEGKQGLEHPSGRENAPAGRTGDVDGGGDQQ